MKTFLTLVLCGAMFASNAQESWTLEKCIEYALEHNISVKQSEISLEMAKQDKISNNGALLPTLNGSASHSFNFGRNVDPFTNQFTTQTIQSGNYGLSAGMDLFSGLRNWQSIKKAELDVVASKFDLDAIKNDISINVALSYMNILLAIEGVNIAVDQLKLTNDQVKRIDQLVVAGAMAKGNLFDIKAQQATDEQNLVNAENQRDLANLSMGILLELDDPASFRPAISDFSMPNGALLQKSPEQIFNVAVNYQPALKAGSIRILSAERQLAIARGGIIPSLRLQASYGTGFSDGAMLFQDGMLVPKPISDQLNENIGQSLGFFLSVPILNGWSNRTNVNRSQLGILSASYSYEQTENNMRQSIYQSHADAQAALKRYNASIRSVEALKESFDYTTERFRLGIVNSYDFNDAKTRLAAAESDLLQAKYDYIFKLRILEFYNSSNLSY